MSKIFQYPWRPLDWAATPHDFAGDYQLGPYQVELTQRYIPGTRYLMWDGRVFKYARCLTALHSYRLCGTSDAAADAYSTALVTSVGSRQVNVTMGSRTEDDLAGGFIELYDSTDNQSVLRGIVGNETTSGTTTIVYIDYPLQAELTGSDHTEVFENPYIEMTAADNGKAFYGVAATHATALQYFWIQTWGPCMVGGGGTVVCSATEKDVVADAAGSLHMQSAHENYQRVGFILTGGYTPLAGPMIMLQMSI